MYEASGSWAAFQPGAQEAQAPSRPRGGYAGYRAFGGGDGAVLLAPPVARALRFAAQRAARDWAALRAALTGLPRGVQFTAGALTAVAVAAAVIAGVLTSSALVAVAVAAAGLLVALGSTLISHR